MKRSSDLWILIGLFVLLLVGTYFAASPSKTTESKAPTTYNADPKGTKAFYTLLQRLGYRVDRLRGPYTELPRNARLLIVIEPGEREIKSLGKYGRDISDDEEEALVKWVKAGGGVVILSDGFKGVPARYIDSRDPSVHARNSSAFVTNRGLRDPKNAVRITGLIVSRVSKQDLILFDEYHHGIEGGGPGMASMSRQVKVAVLVLIVAGLILIYSRGRRFGAVRNLPGRDARPGFEYVESVGRLYSRARASDLAADILRDSFRRGLCLKLGLTSDAPRDVLNRRMAEDMPEGVRGRIQSVLGDRNEGYKPSDSELLDMTREIRALEKEISVDG